MSGALFRFLRADRFDPFTGTSWPQDGWAAPREGVVAYPAETLPRWLAHELWVVHLEGATVQREFSVVAERGRLVEPVEAWDRTAAADFVRSLVGRHPSLPYVPVDDEWAPAWEAAYVAAHTAGMDAEEAGGDYAAAETGEWAVQARWLRERLRLD